MGLLNVFMVSNVSDLKALGVLKTGLILILKTHSKRLQEFFLTLDDNMQDVSMTGTF